MRSATGEGGAGETVPLPVQAPPSPQPSPASGRGGYNVVARDKKKRPQRSASPLPLAGEAGARSATGEGGGSRLPKLSTNCYQPLPPAGGIKERAVIDTITMRFHAPEALVYLENLGMKMAIATYYRYKKPISLMDDRTTRFLQMKYAESWK